MPLPASFDKPGDTFWGGCNAFWPIYGEMYLKPVASNTFTLHTPKSVVYEMEKTDITVGSRQMSDVPAGPKDVAKRGVDARRLPNRVHDWR